MSMRSRAGRKTLAIALTAAVTLLMTVGPGGSSASAASASAAPDPTDPAPAVPAPIEAAHGSASIPKNTKFSGPLQHSTKGTHDVFVELAAKSATEASAETLATGRRSVDARASAKAQRKAVKRTAASVLSAARSVDPKAQQLFEVGNAVPGVGLRASKQALDALAARSDVVKISTLVPKRHDNAGAAQLTRVLDTWHDVGATGRGVKIGIIDTGIDYTHADFGGPGTVAAFDAARAVSTGPFTPTAKVVGGYDFVGDDYDGAADGASSVPHPDPNPLDCDGHGTHVSGTAAGYGVTKAGKTFTGDYSKLTGKDLYDMTVGPGMAPKALLYGLRVFGCQGSTNAVIPALDWALDPNGDGDFSDHLDIVNLSLGTDFASVDDPDNTVVDKLAANGVLPVIAMGNGGDLTDVGGSPGNAVRSLAVASSVDQYQLRDGLKVNAPADVAGIVAGQVSAAYPWSTAPDVTGQVATLSDPGNLDGCDPLSTADAARVAGKVAWLEWDDNDATRRCGSAGRSGNVQAAGALGAIFTSSLNVFGAGITGSAIIPVLQLPKAGTDRLRPAAGAGTLNVTFSGSLVATIKEVHPAIADTLSSFSSRGTRGSLGVVKPDVTAPGDTIASAKIGSGNGVIVDSGTSMATPHTAGIAALVKGVHPDWTSEQLKAAVMNTAGHDLYTGLDRTGNRYGPARVGAGRADALSAVRTNLLAYDTDVAGGVSASFGVIEAPIGQQSITRTRTIRVQNTGNTPAHPRLSYQGIVTQPGVSYRVSPSSAWIQPHASAKVTVTMTITPSALRKTLDPTMAAEQTDPALGVNRARQFVSDASGRVLITQTGRGSLRVPVYGAAKPTSETKSYDGRLRQGGAAVKLLGRGVDQGSGSTAFRSLVSVLDLGYTSPKLPTCTTTITTGCTSNASTVAADIHYAGANATAIQGSKANGWLWFGVTTFGNWSAIGSNTIPFVDIDTNGDGTYDYEVDVQNYPSTDLLTAQLFDLSSGDLIDVNPVNFNDGDVDTNPFDTNVALVPVWPAAIGLTDGVTAYPISYSVGTFSGEYGIVVDRTPPVTFDVANPRVQVSDPLFHDKGGVAIPYTLGSTGAAQLAAARSDPAAVQATHASPAKALVVHLHGPSQKRVELLTLRG